jgi:hypothetical protein
VKAIGWIAGLALLGEMVAGPKAAGPTPVVVVGADGKEAPDAAREDAPVVLASVAGATAVVSSSVAPADRARAVGAPADERTLAGLGCEPLGWAVDEGRARVLSG